MSHLLHRAGRSAIRHPLVVWLFAAIVVLGASTAVGQDFDETFDVRGLRDLAGHDSRGR